MHITYDESYGYCLQGPFVGPSFGRKNDIIIFSTELFVGLKSDFNGVIIFIFTRWV